MPGTGGGNFAYDPVISRNDSESRIPGRAGLGLRRELIPAMQETPPALNFVELAPENWMDVGGRFRAQLEWAASRYPLVCHGLSLSLGGPAPLDIEFLRRLRRFLDTWQVRLYSEHLSYCGDDGHLYDLLPIPFTDEAVRYTAERIRTAQDILGRRIAIENVSYYAAPGRAMDEISFVNAVLDEADCELLLDVNNVYVNSINHGYDARAFLAAVPVERIAYLHVAGHRREAPDLVIDTHGAAVADPVWELLGWTYVNLGVYPTLLERDFQMPPLAELLDELEIIRTLQRGAEPEARRA